MSDSTDFTVSFRRGMEVSLIVYIHTTIPLNHALATAAAKVIRDGLIVDGKLAPIEVSDKPDGVVEAHES